MDITFIMVKRNQTIKLKLEKQTYTFKNLNGFHSIL